MATAYLTRRIQFSAAHRYFRPEWSEERNREVFGACAHPHGHGHTYRLEMTVAGEVDPATGFCVPLAALDALLRREVTERLDHRHLNHDVAEFRAGAAVPTTENILLYLWPRLEAGLPAGTALDSLRLDEDGTFHVELRRGSGELP
jgi:6-pyruvoyltetrahydropterin/6-carboxytetrahydropterin synthase